ncbi:MAG: hypothetical protein J3K34DRAFT_521879 [Monoraphidium minutum]|nr:MAG: hypothetical protein J3K34DRAFT_521879 [Monoraphidium minutum]
MAPSSLSRLWARAKRRVGNPRQLTHPHCPSAARAALAWCGRAGWAGKAALYAIIGGLAADSAVNAHAPRPASTSPEGAFVLLGRSGPSSIGFGLLLAMAAALLFYITWRFSEALAGQGYDAEFSAAKNFFKYRLSPAVSGGVYCSYMAFLINAMHIVTVEGPSDARLAAANAQRSEGWPNSWRFSTAGRVGLALVGLAFLIATAIQLQGVLTRGWHRDYRQPTGRWGKRAVAAVFTLGHVGFAGRAGAFLAMAVFFLKDAAGADDVDHSSSMVANALMQLQASPALRAVLFVIGALLVTYGAFAAASAAGAREFPTPPPSRRPRRAASAAAGLELPVVGAEAAGGGGGGGAARVPEAAPGKARPAGRRRGGGAAAWLGRLLGVARRGGGGGAAGREGAAAARAGNDGLQWEDAGAALDATKEPARLVAVAKPLSVINEEGQELIDGSTLRPRN